MHYLIATTFEVVHYIALQAVHYKPLQERYIYPAIIKRFDKEYIIKDLNSLDDTLSSFISYIQNAKEIDINECGDKIEDIRVGISKFKHSVDIFQVKISNFIQIDTIFEKLYKQGTSQVGQVIMGKDAPKCI